jgi:alkaline phosphatase D
MSRLLDDRYALSRRRLFALTGAAVGAATLSRESAHAQVGWSAYPFQLGVAAGDPGPDGFVIWTRLAPDPLNIDGYGAPRQNVTVGWEVASDEGFRTVVQKGEAVARPELGHAVHVEVSGLEPARPYWYRFSSGRERSLTGRAVTTPLAGADPERVRFGIVGCQHYEQGYYTAYRRLAEEPLDFVYCYGDYIYEGRGARVWNGPTGPRQNVRQHVGGETYSLDDYRRRHAQYKMDADLQAAHAAHAWFVTWDDHEIDNNWVADADQDGTPPEVFALRRQVAVQAYYEHMPLRARSFPTGTSLQLYRRADYGRLLRANFLDTRQYRSDQACGDRWNVVCDQLEREATVLGERQEAWLAEGLARSPARWNALAQQVMVMDLDRNPDEPYTVNLDSWGGYRKPRERLLRAMQAGQARNAVVLTGDEHQHYAGELHLDGRRPGPKPIGVEFVATSISSGGDGQDQRPDMVRIQAANPQLKFNNSQRGYVVCDVSAERWRTDFKVLDKVTERDGTLSTRASFAVEAGEARLQPA